MGLSHRYCRLSSTTPATLKERAKRSDYLLVLEAHSFVGQSSSTDSTRDDRLYDSDSLTHCTVSRLQRIILHCHTDSDSNSFMKWTDRIVSGFRHFRGKSEIYRT
jgi:hypothetical protein